MNNYSSLEYTETKKWISEKITEGFDWESVKLMCTSQDNAEKVFLTLRDDELIIPDTMTFSEWIGFVEEMRKSYSIISDPYGLSRAGIGTSLPIPTDVGSPWVQYKKYLLGQKDGKQRINEDAVAQIEKNSHWILNHLLRDTTDTGPRKGLVMGSVQSGKTANMIGLATMVAHYDWNYIIILSGSIDNLRIQTRNRFMSDLLASGGVKWHFLEKTGNPDYLMDLQTGEKIFSDKLELNLYQTGNSGGSLIHWMHRYVTVCLKNSTRLRNLIKWLHANKNIAARLRILVIDDEADQASVNTKNMNINEMDEELIERTTVNQLIINLVIVILSYYRLDNPNCCLFGINPPSDIGDIKFNQISDFANCKHIRYYTIQKFKGLEAKAVIMIDIDSLSDNDKRYLNYVGMSRARTYLEFFYDNSLYRERQQRLLEALI